MIGFLVWHYTTAFETLLIIFRNLLYFLLNYFSIPYLLPTLFSPWKREVFKDEGPGFNLKKRLEALSMNLISRIIGAIIRTLTIFTWILATLVTIALFAELTVLFIIVPIFSLPFYFSSRRKKDNRQENEFILSRLELGKLDKVEEKDIAPEDLKSVRDWYERQKKERDFEARFWELENLQKIKCIGKDWAYGYTINLNKFSTDLNDESKNTPKLIGRNQEIQTLERILSKRGENNILLIGNPGVGRKTIVLGLAQRIFEGKTTAELSHKRVLMFDLNTAISEGETIEAKRAKLLEILNEAKIAGNIILVISSFDRFVASDADRTNLTEVFTQTIGGSDLQIIGLITPEDYHQHILTNPSILKLFEKVEVFPPSPKEATNILEDLVPSFEAKHKIFISFFALKEIVNKSDTLVSDIPFPEKAINLLDEAVFFSLNKENSKFLSKEIVDKLLSEKTKIPIGQITQSEKDKLLNLEGFLHEHIVGQEEAVSALGKAMRRGRIGINNSKRPIASFLFLGPTGVGKTETAKALASLYFGSEQKMIRFDMAEFIGTNAVENLIGSNEKPGLLTKAVKDSPFGVLLLDEFEKTTPEVLNLFLTVFDEGYLKDVNGKDISFSNLIIIATSNAGAEFIRENLESIDLSKKLTEYVLKEQIFSPEFINRFDGVIVFKPLTKEDLFQIAKLEFNKLNSKLDNQYHIKVKITDNLLNQISTLGFDPTFGARPMRRVIQDKIEAPVAQMILEGKVKKGKDLEINLD